MVQLNKPLLWTGLLRTAVGLSWSQEYVDYNLNENKTATDPLDYYGVWANHTFNPSPDNWRFPFYTIMLDAFVNGDPTNDNANGTQFEHDMLQTQLRHGGDIQGVIDSLDYLQGMGIKGLYIAGSPFINEPWGADSYSPLDLTLLDLHYAKIEKYREMVTEIHNRGMYIIADNTMATMGNLNMAVNYENTSTPFSLSEHKQAWRDPNRQYLDFKWSNDYNDTCDYPRFYLDTGYEVNTTVTDEFKGCYNSEFDHYGDVEAFGVFPDWKRQLAKFASVQDRLREWHDPVRAKIKHFACMSIKSLDIDGFRLDKATQITVDALGDWSHDMRECANSVNKTNFFIPGEITGGNTFGSIYLGRGRDPDMITDLTITEAVKLTDDNDTSLFIRDKGQNALDAAAFHYSIYRTLTRFLGMDGNLAAGYDVPLNWVDAWNEILVTNDLVNPNTNEFDVRHMYGVANQDVFRWPAVSNGTQRQLLAEFITTLQMPGIPMVLWGEEQAFYILDNTASNYIFGRQAMSSAVAWQTHGCYTLGAEQYYDWPVNASLYGCSDDWNSKDHRDPSAPVRNTLKAMYEMRQNYPVLNDGYFLQQLSNYSRDVYYPGSEGVATPTGVWSVVRGEYDGVQDLSSSGGQGNQSVWLVYTNENHSTTVTFDCSSNDYALLSPFPANTTVKNLFYPHDEYTLSSSNETLYLYGSQEVNGCIDKMDFPQYGFKAFVPVDSWVTPIPTITKFTPGHDYRLKSTVAANEQEEVAIEIYFSQEMNCDALKGSITLNSTTESGKLATLDNSTVVCENITALFANDFVGTIPSTWKFSANLTNVYNGVHSLTVKNASNEAGTAYTGAVDKFIFRIGQVDNPIIFPMSANYTEELLHQDDNGTLYVTHKAAGADYWRYTLDWTTYSDWKPYVGGNDTLEPKNWTGTAKQAWEGEHVIVQYYNQMSGSSDYQQHADLSTTQVSRRFPHLFAMGTFNEYGYDAGLKNHFKQDGGGTWRYNWMTEWTDETLLQVNVWGMNPDGAPDQTGVYGDVDDDGVLDRMAPSSLATKAVNVTKSPAWPHLGYLVSITDSNLRYTLTPIGNQWIQLAMYVIMLVIPITTAVLSVWLYMKSFYAVKFNTDGVTEKAQYIPLAIRRRLGRGDKSGAGLSTLSLFRPHSSQGDAERQAAIIEAEAGAGKRRTVLIATMEYDIEDWAVKIKIGGLGVMAQLMGKSLGTQDLIWVVPCVGGIDYPEDTPAESMFVTILGEQYEVQVQYHVLRNITYVLLDAPVFRAQSKSVPYPARMDDLESAIYYSTWNQCIAETVKRFPIDLYHINDYHGACAPLYLLPERTIPCALSLHNAEFQGLWPLRTAKEHKEVCEVFNLSPEIVKKYVQFGDVFNLLHAAASYLRVHQKGFGAVGVSKKYGARSHARYPIFWGLDKIGQLPNPDPSDTGEWTGEESKVEVVIDEEFEAARPELKRQAQEWAGLDQNPNADLLVFVGRWSMQKGVDLIADVMPHVLETNPNVQLICVGPQIDLYGKFAALKLDVMMKKYPGKVFSKPEFTALPPFIFSGAEFALIPSRDEPFGLVAVEFGRKGALGIGARVGGLGQMPGWWFTVESTTTSHMISQFKIAIKDALASDTQTRRIMRAKSAKQRFPVAQWISQLEKLQSSAIKKHNKEAAKRPANARSLGAGLSYLSLSRPKSANSQTGSDEDQHSAPNTPGTPGTPGTLDQSRPVSRNLPIFAPRLGNPGGDYSLPGDISHLESPGESPRTSLALGEAGQADYMPRSPNALGMSFRPGTASVLSLNTIVGEKTDFQLQKIDPDFTDSRGEYYKTFEESLEKLDGDNSEDLLCIETFLMKSEKKWYSKFKDAKLGRASMAPSRRNSLLGSRSIAASEAPSISQGLGSTMGLAGIVVAQNNDSDENDEWLLGADYAPPKGVQWFMAYRIGDWPIYSFFLAFGQIIAANSYQVSLLTGSTGQTANQLYEIAGVYLGTSMIWWVMFMRFKSVYTLSTPFFFYGLAFLALGTAPFASTGGRNALKTFATLMYSTASSSGSIFFALNFGDEGGSPIKTWVFRSCVIQGTQTIYITALWAWGSYLTKETNLGFKGATVSTSNKAMAYIAIPIAVLLWVVGYLVYIGLPKYYRQAPGKVPSFYRSLFRRKVVLWFFCYVLIQNFFLSSLTGRNWSYLWSSSHAKVWEIVLLVLLFFIVIWAVFLWGFSILSRDHSWILPIFAIGLGAPRWAQILWSCSNIGLWVPWAGSPLASAIAGRSLWLWLGTLDAIQGVGFGMILLQTLTRVHIASALTGAQILGSLATIVARAAGPSKLGPGDVFPDFTPGVYPGIKSTWFWVGLIFQFIICAGFFRFFRKEQLSKP